MGNRQALTQSKPSIGSKIPRHEGGDPVMVQVPGNVIGRESIMFAGSGCAEKGRSPSPVGMSASKYH